MYQQQAEPQAYAVPYQAQQPGNFAPFPHHQTQQAIYAIQQQQQQQQPTIVPSADFYAQQQQQPVHPTMFAGGYVAQQPAIGPPATAPAPTQQPQPPAVPPPPAPQKPMFDPFDDFFMPAPVLNSTSTTPAASNNNNINMNNPAGAGGVGIAQDSTNNNNAMVVSPLPPPVPPVAPINSNLAANGTNPIATCPHPTPNAVPTAYGPPLAAPQQPTPMATAPLPQQYAPQQQYYQPNPSQAPASYTNPPTSIPVAPTCTTNGEVGLTGQPTYPQGPPQQIPSLSITNYAYTYPQYQPGPSSAPQQQQGAVPPSNAYHQPAPAPAPAVAPQQPVPGVGAPAAGALNPPIASAPTSVLAPSPLQYGAAGQLPPPVGMGQPAAYGSVPYGYVPPQPQPQPQPPSSLVATTTSTSIDADRAKLEEIIRLRKELEREQEREKQKRMEMESWPCKECTYQNKLTSDKCEMCDAQRPGSAPTPTSSANPVTTPSTSKVASASNRSSGGAPSPSSTTSQAPQGILKPQSRSVHFPASKWGCSTCGLSNPNEVYNCRACNTKRRPEDALSPAGGYANNGDSGKASSDAPSPNEYSCPTCTLFNPKSAASCSACTTPNPHHSTLRGVVSNSTGSVGGPTQQQLEHIEQMREAQIKLMREQQQQQRGIAAGGGNVPRIANTAISTTWNCPSCTFVNKSAAAQCEMCTTANPNPTPSNRSSVTQPSRGGATPGYPAARVANNAGGRAANHVPPSRPATANNGSDSEDENDVQWQKDNVVENCNKCHDTFSMFNRRHHCRACGFVFCGKCSNFKIKLKDKASEERVCLDCYRERLK